MFLRQRTYALLVVMILIGVMMLAQSAVRSMEPSKVLGDWQMSPLSWFVCDLLLLFSFIAIVSISHSILIFAKKTYGGVQCLRFGGHIFDHISDVSDSILGCFYLTYIEFRLACFMFSLVTGGSHR
jgi:hypothetical protein